MSKNIVFGGQGTSGFTGMLSTVGDSVIAAQRKTGSAKLQAGMQALYEKAKADGYEAGIIEGREQGRQEGLQKAQQEFQEAHRSEIQKFHLALEAFVDRARSSVDAWYSDAEESLTTLAIEIARRALCQELEQSRDSVLAITKQALEEIRHGTDVRIRVNPVDASILESHREEILASACDVRGLEVVPDLHIASGCEIETDAGVIDARIQSYLARIALEAA